MSKESELLELIESGKNVSMLSQGGTGKSTLIKMIKKTWESHYNFQVTSTTGVSAYLIGGRTIHSFSGIGVLNPKQDTLKKLKRIKKQKKE